MSDKEINKNDITDNNADDETVVIAESKPAKDKRADGGNTEKTV